MSFVRFSGLLGGRDDDDDEEDQELGGGSWCRPRG